jgi:predicted nucleic acid-binding protein
MLVVADTSPLNYLVLIGHVGVLAEQVGDVHVPSAVLDELQSDRAPAAVRRWASRCPAWLIPRDPSHLLDLPELDAGERAAISLAREIGADRLLIDEAAGRSVAVGRFGLRVSGTIGVIRDAAIADLLDLETAIAALRATNFRFSEKLLQQVRDSVRVARERGER